MSEENRENLQRVLDAFNRRDQAAGLAALDPECEYFPPQDWPENAPITGAEAIWDYYVEAVDAWEDDPFELLDPIDAGADKIVANQRRVTRGRASGASAPWNYWIVFTFRDAKVVRFEMFADRADALEAAGLRE
jgi:ketosteroid isomerase-like protein